MSETPATAITAIEQLKTAIRDHFEWCAGTPPNDEIKRDEAEIINMVDNISKASQVRVIYSNSPIEIVLWDGRHVEIGKKVVQIRKGGNVQAVYHRSC